MRARLPSTEQPVRCTGGWPGDKSERMGGRLFRYERRIVANTARSIFVRWPDRLLAATILLVLAASIRSWLADQTGALAAWTGLGAGAVIGVIAGRVLAQRIAFHTFDGPFAEDALRFSTRLRFVAIWHLIVLTALAGIILAVGPSLLIVCVPGYFCGMAIGDATASVNAATLTFPRPRIKRRLRSMLRQPGAGIVGAAGLLVLLSATQQVALAVTGVATMIVALAMTMVDDNIVRFMTVTGRGSWYVVARHAAGMLAFVTIAVPVGFFAFGPMAAGLIMTISVAAVLLLTIRVLAYRLHGKRFADWLVFIVIVAVALAAILAPFVLPGVVYGILWHLHRRAAGMTWILA